MKLSHLLIACIVLAGIVFFAWHEWRLGGNGSLRLHVLDVGQGDAILLVSPSGKQILVDGGPDASALAELGKTMPFLDRTIELLVLTHPDKDHVAALPDVLARYRVQRVLMTGVKHDSQIYASFLRGVRDEARQGAEVIFADPRKDLDMGDGLVLDVVWPEPGLNGEEVKASNDTSVVVRALFAEHSILLTGDIELDAEGAIVASGIDIDADVLKVAHHGSKTSSMEEFVRAVSPDLALISAGRNNRYGHPSKIVLERFEAMGIPIRSTQEEGTMCLRFPREGAMRGC